MSIRTKEELKSYFNTGDRPTESNFSDVIDTICDASIVVNLDSRVAYASTHDSLHFNVEISTSPTFTTDYLVVSSDSFTDQTNWEYRIGNYLVPLTVVGLTSAYQNTTYGSVIYTWTEAQINNAYYVRYRSYYDAGIAGYQYSPYKIEKVIL